MNKHSLGRQARPRLRISKWSENRACKWGRPSSRERLIRMLQPPDRVGLGTPTQRPSGSMGCWATRPLAKARSVLPTRRRRRSSHCARKHGVATVPPGPGQHPWSAPAAVFPDLPAAREPPATYAARMKALELEVLTLLRAAPCCSAEVSGFVSGRGTGFTL